MNRPRIIRYFSSSVWSETRNYSILQRPTWDTTQSSWEADIIHLSHSTASLIDVPVDIHIGHIPAVIQKRYCYSPYSVEA